MNEELAKLRQGGEVGLADVFSEHRGRLERMVRFRLDQSLRGRIDPDDVLQDAYIEIARRPAIAMFGPSHAWASC